ncbi:hypothetical protein [Qipengyuania seohaensis]|uniref:hypothetical protein n=1 Tax=Qipengyuania seohaensis TaxID=266951 RepID=UPI0012FE5E20|nr:hypothetical protein [Qipengyuania seohaensis]
MQKWLHVFRIRCEPFDQTDLFAEEREASDVILDSILAHPTAEVGGGSEWHIAAAEKFAGRAIIFQFGRVQSITSPQYDGTRERFYEAEAERAPYVHGVFDGETQACVIEKKSGVTAKPSEVAAKLQKLLNSVDFPAKSGFRVVVDELRDPENFIEQVRQAERITRFQFTAEFENPHDVYKLIHEPAEQYNEQIRGQKTTVETRGEDLNKDVVEEMARSAASVGDTASATILDGERGRGRVIYLRGTPLLEKLEFSAGLEDIKERMLAALKAAYIRLRYPRDD